MRGAGTDHGIPTLEQRITDFMGGLKGLLRDHRKRSNFAQYALGLLSPSERKSVEPIAAMGLDDPADAQRAHGRLLHFIGDAHWSDTAVRQYAARYALDVMLEQGPVRSWIVDDTGFLKQGTHSPCVKRMYTGSAGKIANCQLAVSLTVATESMHLPVDMDLFMPEDWAADAARRTEVGIPESLEYRPKWKIAVDMIHRAIAAGIPTGVVLADSAYGDCGPFRAALRKAGLQYAVGVKATAKVRVLTPMGTWAPARTLSEIAASVRSNLRRRITWREGTGKSLSSRFHVCTVRVGSDRHTQTLVIEWRDGERPEIKFTLSTLPQGMVAASLVDPVMDRWRTERVYQDLKGELGLDHYEGRKYVGWQHHVRVVLCCAALVTAERARGVPPSARRSQGRNRNALAA